MSWHYQLMKHKLADDDDYYAIHEYYYHEFKPKSADSWTEQHFVTSDTPEEMVEILQRMIADIEKHGVKDFD